MPGRARTPGRHRRLGGPLPRQLPNTTTARPEADGSFGEASMPTPSLRWGLPAVSRGYTHPRGWLPSPYSPFRRWRIATPARLACLIHAANVHSEPGSNPSQMVPDASARRPSTPRSPSAMRSEEILAGGYRGQGPFPAEPVSMGRPRRRWPGFETEARDVPKDGPRAGSPRGLDRLDPTHLPSLDPAPRFPSHLLKEKSVGPCGRRLAVIHDRPDCQRSAT